MFHLVRKEPMTGKQRSEWSDFAITNALLAINVAMYVWMVFFHHVSPTSPGTEQIIRWGGNFGPLTISSQPWRLLTSIFVHIGFLHLLANMWALWVLGRLAEAVYGRWTYLAAYLLAGLAGSTASLLWNPLGVSAGASGAIFGIAGALVATFLVGKLPLRKQEVRYLLITLIAFCVFVLLYGIWKAGVDNAAHIGGFVMGGLLGLTLGHFVEKDSRSRQARGQILVAAALVVLLFAAAVWKKDSYAAEVRQAELMLGQGDMNGAVAKLQRAADKRPNEPYILNLLGGAYIRQGKFPQAEATYRRLTQLKPNDSASWAGLAQSTAAEGKFSDSASAWTQAAQLAKNGGGLYWYNAGQSYARTGKQQESIQAFQKTVALAPNFPEAWGALGYAELKAGQNQQAVASLEKAVRLKPGNPDLRLILGNAYLAVGNQQQAQEQFFQASKLRAAIAERMKKMHPPQPEPQKAQPQNPQAQPEKK